MTFLQLRHTRVYNGDASVRLFSSLLLLQEEEEVSAANFFFVHVSIESFVQQEKIRWNLLQAHRISRPQLPVMMLVWETLKFPLSFLLPPLFLIDMGHSLARARFRERDEMPLAI